MWAMIACSIALAIWTVILQYTDRRNKKMRDVEEINGSLSFVVEGKE